MIIEIVNQETVIDVNGETFTAEVLVTDASEENAKRFALEALVSAQEAEVSAQEADANATIATNQAIIATNQALLASAARLNAQNAADAAEASEDAAALSASTAASAALNTPLTGFATGANTTILPTDTTLQAFGKTQGQISERIGGTVGAGQVAFGTGTKLLGGDNGLFWDNTNKRLGIGTAIPTQALDVRGIAKFITGNFNPQIIVARNANQGVGEIQFGDENQSNVIIGGSQVNGMRYNSQINHSFFNNTVESFRIFNATRNVLIQNGGTFTDAGFRLDVNGTARVQGVLNISTGSTKINIGSFSNATLPSTINDGDIYSYGGDLWINSIYSSTRKGVVYTKMKLTGLQPDFFYNSTAAKNFNQFNSSNFNTFGWGSLVHTGYSYGNTIMVNNPTSVGVDSRMYDGFLMSVNGQLGYDPNPQLFVDIKGSIFARGNGTYAETDWKKALTDNTNTSTTLGSGNNYASAKFVIDSTTKGFLPPRLTLAQRDAIATPATGLMVYNTTDNRPSFYNGTTWINL